MKDSLFFCFLISHWAFRQSSLQRSHLNSTKTTIELDDACGIRSHVKIPLLCLNTTPMCPLVPLVNSQKHPADAQTKVTESVPAAQVVPEYDACTSSNDTHRLDMGNWTKLNFGNTDLVRVIPGSLIYCFASQLGSRQNTALESDGSLYKSLVESSGFQGNGQLQAHLGPEAYLSMEVSYWIGSGAARVQDNQPGRSLSFARMLLRFGLLQRTSGRNTRAHNTSGLSFATRF